MQVKQLESQIRKSSVPFRLFSDKFTFYVFSFLTKNELRIWSWFSEPDRNLPLFSLTLNLFQTLKTFINLKIIDKRNQQLKFEILDVNKPFKADAKVVGSNLGQSILFFIDNNRTNKLVQLFWSQTDAVRVN